MVDVIFTLYENIKCKGCGCSFSMKSSSGKPGICADCGSMLIKFVNNANTVIPDQLKKLVFSD